MTTATSLRRMRRGFRASLALVLVAQVACSPRIVERCRLVTNPTPPPSLPAGLAELDALVLRRATDMTVASRDLNNSLVIVFHKDFAELLLPALCERLEQARALAMAGRTAEAGRKYQALLVSSQILAYAVAIQAMAQYADRRLQPGGQVSETQEKFASEAEPIFRAALSEDPLKIERALNAHPEVFASWAVLMEQWPSRVDDGAHKAKVAMVVWDIAFLVVATYRAAGAAAELAASGRPPMPPLPAFATAEGVAAINFSGPAALELAETLRRLIALGALDVEVVAALSRSLGAGGAPSTPILPSATQMSGGSNGGTPSRDPTGSARPTPGKAAGPATRPFGGLSRAAEFGIKPYSEMTGALRGTELQAHHLIEQRFAYLFEGNAGAGDLSVAVTRAEHQAFTNAWRRAFPYGAGTQEATRAAVMREASRIYANYPAILRALGL